MVEEMTEWTLATSALLLGQLGLEGGGVEGGIFTRITMTSMTGCWYQPISNFEAIIVGIVILEILVMRYMLILPLDFSKWIQEGVLLQTVLSRRKKRSIGMTLDNYDGSEESVKSGRLIETMFTVIRRLDKEDCFLRSLCELQRYQVQGAEPPLPHRIQDLLAIVKSLKTELIVETLWKNDTQSLGPPVLPLIRNSILEGDGSSGNCLKNHAKCPLEEHEIIEYLQNSYFKVI